jgi:hypothetical protein
MQGSIDMNFKSLNIGRIVDDGIAFYRTHWRDCYLWALLFTLSTLFYPVVQNLTQNRFILGLTIIVWVLITNWFALCLIYQLEAAHRQKPLTKSEILMYAASRIPQVIICIFLIFLAAVLCAAPFLLLFLNQNPIFIAIIAMAVVGLVFWTIMSLCFAPVIIVSNNLGPLDALTRSWRLMQGLSNWLSATVVLSLGAVIFTLLRVLPILLSSILLAFILKLQGQTFEMQMLQNPFVNFNFGIAGILILFQAVLVAIFQPISFAVYLKQYHHLEARLMEPR